MEEGRVDAVVARASEVGRRLFCCVVDYTVVCVFRLFSIRLIATVTSNGAGIGAKSDRDGEEMSGEAGLCFQMGF